MKRILYTLVILIVIACKNISNNSDIEIAKKIEQLVNQNDSFVVDSLSAIDWDELVIIKPYMNDAQFENLNSKYKNLPWYRVESFDDDRYNYLVFCKNGTALKFTQIIRSPCCDFKYVGKEENPAYLKRGRILYIKRKPDGQTNIYDQNE